MRERKIEDLASVAVQIHQKNWNSYCFLEMAFLLVPAIPGRTYAIFPQILNERNRNWSSSTFGVENVYRCIVVVCSSNNYIIK
jgi:hypothetical protein